MISTKVAIVTLAFSTFSAAYSTPTVPLPAEEPVNNELTTPVSKYLRARSASIDVAFLSGGSITGTNAIGARYFIFQDFALGIYGQYSHDTSQSLTSMGLTLRAQSYLAQNNRSHFFLFAQGSIGQNKRSSTTETSDTTGNQAGGIVGGGLEIFLLPELSTSVDLGLGGVLSPSSRATLSTGTSQIALHYFFQGE